MDQELIDAIIVMIEFIQNGGGEPSEREEKAAQLALECLIAEGVDFEDQSSSGNHGGREIN